MFEKYDLTKKLDRETFENEIPPLQTRLGILQREFHDHRIPIMILVEGWNASGITMVINELIQNLDPRGFSLHSIGSPFDEERVRPFIWRFWTKIPPKGRIAFFARSWYSRALAEKISNIDLKGAILKSVNTINRFERQFYDDGGIILKFFLHISKEEQNRRLDERENNVLTSWMITKGDWDFHYQYDLYKPIIEQIIENTDTQYAPWTIVEATDSNYTILKVYTTVIKTLEKQLDRVANGRKNEIKNEIIKPKKIEVKCRAKPPITYSKTEYQTLLLEYQEKIRNIHYRLYKRKIPVIIIFEGWDAAGKGGNIMRLVRHMNPRGYDVIPIGRPDQTELNHHYLWRFYQRYPRAGHITIFDRSWYGRVLVERVEGFCSENEWKRAYNEINETELEYIESGGGLFKFWLEIDEEEQLKRFTSRQKDPLKQWKITDEDWRNRKKWDDYNTAVEEMLSRTSTKEAPWTMVESNDKWYARLKTLKTVIEYSEMLFR